MKEQEEDNIRLVEYLEGALSAEEVATLELEISRSTQLQQALEDLKRLYSSIDEAEKLEPSEGLNQEFYQFLETEKKSQSGSGKRVKLATWRTLAATVSLLLIVAVTYTLQLRQGQQVQISQLQTQMEETKKLLILSMLQNPSASDRLQAVNVSIKETEVDDQILKALAHTLNYDDNVNVRLKAVQAMAQFIGEEEVVNMLLESLLEQSYPQVQIALIEALTIARKKEALKAFETLLEREELLEVVKGKAAEGIGILL